MHPSPRLCARCSIQWWIRRSPQAKGANACARYSHWMPTMCWPAPRIPHNREACAPRCLTSPVPLRCSRPPHWCTTTSLTTRIYAAASPPRTARSPRSPAHAALAAGWASCWATCSPRHARSSWRTPAPVWSNIDAWWRPFFRCNMTWRWARCSTLPLSACHSTIRKRLPKRRSTCFAGKPPAIPPLPR